MYLELYLKTKIKWEAGSITVFSDVQNDLRT